MDAPGVPDGGDCVNILECDGVSSAAPLVDGTSVVLVLVLLLSFAGAVLDIFRPFNYISFLKKNTNVAIPNVIAPNGVNSEVRMVRTAPNPPLEAEETVTVGIAIQRGTSEERDINAVDSAGASVDTAPSDDDCGEISVDMLGSGVVGEGRGKALLDTESCKSMLVVGAGVVVTMSDSKLMSNLVSLTSLLISLLVSLFISLLSRTKCIAM